MKNKLNEIFDEAKPQELDQFSNELTAPALPDEVLASVKGKVFAKTNLKKENKNTKSVWLRVGAVAACFLLIVSAVIVVPMLRDDDIGIKPYIPNGDPWSPVIDSSIRDIVLSADEVGNVFDAVMDSNGTNQYTKIYTSLPEYLGITPLPNAEFLPIYSTNKNSPSKSELNDFIVEYLNSATEFFGVNEKNYEIEKDEMPNGDAFFEAEVSENKNKIAYGKRECLTSFLDTPFLLEVV